MQEGPRPAPPALTDAGLDGAVIVLAGRRAEEVALWITLLLSPWASFMTGPVIPLDGG